MMEDKLKNQPSELIRFKNESTSYPRSSEFLLQSFHPWPSSLPANQNEPIGSEIRDQSVCMKFYSLELSRARNVLQDKLIVDLIYSNLKLGIPFGRWEACERV